MGFKPVKECSNCNGIGYKIVRNPSLDPTKDRWVRVFCPKCKGRGFLR